MSASFGYEGSSGRDTTRVGNAWGTRGGSLIRSVLNAVIPVTIIERIYGELEGSLFGLTAGTAGALAFRPAIELFSFRRDWELHEINVSYPLMFDVGLTAGTPNYRMVVNMFTAFGGFNPIEFNQTIVFGPQLITNESFNQGTVRARGGVAATNNPFGIGWRLSDNLHRVGTMGTGATSNKQQSDSAGRIYISSGGADRLATWDKKLFKIKFERPLRVLRNRRITISLHAEDVVFSYNPVHTIEVSALYSELPNPRDSYMT